MKYLLTAALLGSAIAGSAMAQDVTVGVSWSNFRRSAGRPTRRRSRPSSKARREIHLRRRAELASKQLSDIESLISQGQPPHHPRPGQRRGEARARRGRGGGIPVVGYDRLIEDPRAFYLTFDNMEVGRMEAAAVFALAPKGNYVMIKGSPTDPNADFLRAGQQEVLQKAIDAGDVKIVGEAYTDGWLPANAQRNMEQILTANDNKVDAVVASNDGTAGGAIAALNAQGMAGIPVSGQDADAAALNRVALGTQTVTIWKDSRELSKTAADIAVSLASGKTLDQVEGAKKWTSAGGVALDSIFLVPVPVTKDNLGVVVDAGWIKKDALCAGVSAGSVAACD